MNPLSRQMLAGMAGDAQRGGSRIAAHLPTLYVLAREHSWAPIVECGVGRGWSTIAILSGLDGSSGRLHSYDHDPGSRFAALANMKLDPADPLLRHWTFERADSRDAAAAWQPESVGMWFLDTIHDYQTTLQELVAWAPKIHREGIICGHDYLLHERWGPSRAGVDRAVAEFQKSERGHRYRLQVIPGDDGFFILWPI